MFKELLISNSPRHVGVQGVFAPKSTAVHFLHGIKSNNSVEIKHVTQEAESDVAWLKNIEKIH